MASSSMMMVVLAICSTTLQIHAAPIAEGSLLDPGFRAKPVGILFAPELRRSEVSSYPYEVTKNSFNHRWERMKRSPLDQETQEQADDLTAAAGTNLLRPLFVYRQQMAYRERSRKDGRRAAPAY